MKNLLLLLISCLIIPPSIFAQAPQGLNYQAVAYNGSGTPVINQPISVRFSILDGSATGTLVYEETQNPTTDNTGLFSIVIGNGTVVSGTFNTINWGNGSKWLKTEIDITGGTSYLVMGTSQFMSVPYALYANVAGKAEVGSPGFSLPDGFSNIQTVVIPANTNYIVPAGKNLYVTAGYSVTIINNDTLGSFSNSIGIDYARAIIGVSDGSTVSFVGAGRIGFLTDKLVEWKTINLISTPFTVPANKVFVVVNSMIYNHGNTACVVNINGVPISLTTPFNNSIFEPGSVISTTGCSGGIADGSYLLNGYFKDR